MKSNYRKFLASLAGESSTFSWLVVRIKTGNPSLSVTVTSPHVFLLRPSANTASSFLSTDMNHFPFFIIEPHNRRNLLWHVRWQLTRLHARIAARLEILEIV